MKIGLLGGSFNPIHNAHVCIARAAQESCQLDRVYFIPADAPPHKTLVGNVSFEIRAHMVSMAIAESPNFEISTIEGERGGTSYSIDTIRSFRERFLKDELYFIIGGDSYLELDSWNRYAEIFHLCSLIVVERPDCPIIDPINALPDAVKESFICNDSTGLLTHRSGNAVFFVSGYPMELSSTDIRRCVATGEDISRFVPPGVAEYISQQRIYQT